MSLFNEPRSLRDSLGDRSNYSRAAWKRNTEFLAHGCLFFPGYEQGTCEHDHQVLLHYGWFETSEDDQKAKKLAGYKT